MRKDLPTSPIVKLVIIYSLFVVYGSWVPLNFSPLSLGDAFQHFSALPFADQAIDSATDWATNIILLIPFTFLLGHLIKLNLPNNGKLLSVFLASVVGIVLAFFLEFTQIYFPPRTVSQKDILALSLGGLIGATAQLRWGELVGQWLDTLWRAEQGRSGLVKFLHLYLLVVFLFSILPLDLTVSVVDIYHKWIEGRLILVPFSGLKGGSAEILYELGTDVLIWIPVGLLLAMERRSSPIRTAIYVGALAMAIEFAQLFIYSRVTDITDPLLAALGGGLGGYLASRDEKLLNFISACSSAFWYRAWLAWALTMIAVFWFPFDFSVEYGLIKNVREMLTRMPFLSLYQGTEFRAINEIIRKIALFVPGGLILGLAASKSKGSKRVDWPLLLLVASIIEFGQLFLPGKVADTTDILLFFIGGWLGLRLTKAFGNVSWQSLKSTKPLMVTPENRMVRSIDSTNLSRVSIRYSQIVALAVISITLLVLIKLPGIPYNIKELVAPGLSGLFSIAGISVTLLWMINGHFLVIRQFEPASRALYFLPIWLLVHALVAWTLLRLSVPIESIHDIVGSPVLGWIWELELIGRYVALHSAIALPMLGAIILTASLGKIGQKGLPAIWWLWIFLLAWPLHAVIVSQAATDNLTELMHGSGEFAYAMVLAAGIFLASLSATLLAFLLARRKHFSGLVVVIVVAAICSVACFWFGSEPMIIKYGKVFSAWQFLLSPNRNNYIVGFQLWFRFAVAFSAYIALVAMLQYPFWKHCMSEVAQRRYRGHQDKRA